MNNVNSIPNTQDNFMNDFADPKEALDTEMPASEKNEQAEPYQNIKEEVPFSGDTYILSQDTSTGTESSTENTLGEEYEATQQPKMENMTWNVSIDNNIVSPSEKPQEPLTASEEAISPSEKPQESPTASEEVSTTTEQQFEVFRAPENRAEPQAESTPQGQAQGEEASKEQTENSQLAEQESQEGEKAPKEQIENNQPTGEEVESNIEREVPKEREKTRAEERLDAVRRQIEKIEADLAQANNDNARLEEEIATCETALDDNAMTHEQLSDKANQLRDRVNKTKRSIISGFTDGLKIVRNLVLGRHQEVRDIVDNISRNVNDNEQAMQEKEKVEQVLRTNEAERAMLNDRRADAIDIQNTNNRKIANLMKWREDLKKQETNLQEKVEGEAKAKAWEDAREAIKAEMGTNNMKKFRQELYRQKEELEESLQADLHELEGFKNPSRIQRMMRSEEQLRSEAARAERVETELRAEYDKKISEIDSKLAKVEEYFPTWKERVARSRTNPATKRGLATVKRKALLNSSEIAA